MAGRRGAGRAVGVVAGPQRLLEEADLATGSEAVSTIERASASTDGGTLTTAPSRGLPVPSSARSASEGVEGTTTGSVSTSPPVSPAVAMPVAEDMS